MKAAQISTRCECQGRLAATLDEKGRVLSGRASSKGEPELLAPANAIHAGEDQFQVGWLCPFCGRNTVRSFYKGALVYTDSVASAV